MPKKLLLILIITGFISGCSGIKTGWDDFRAYYNTFYNAEEHFQDGLQADQEQSIIISPDQLIRVHQEPVPAGKEAFAQAIQKCSLILRRHSESKWVDDALLLMGKSYYHLRQYTAAVDHFEQVEDFNADKALSQQAAIWKGKALLDLEAYEEGMAYVEHIIKDYPRGWKTQTVAELQVLLGEYNAMLENWAEASTFLSKAIGGIEDNTLLARTYFLYGQVLERQERLGEALYAFKQVSTLFPGFPYTYWALLKEADVNRKQDNFNAALSIYRLLQNNDSYVRQRDHLTYEIAYTLHLQGKIELAKQFYRQLLYKEGEGKTDSRSLQAKTHYQLGKIYSLEYQNYTVAAAYFDTSASLRSSSVFSLDRQTENLADAYGRYADLKKSVQKADSLLWLGSLSPEKLDSAVAQIQSQNREELLNEEENESKEQLINQSPLSGNDDLKDNRSEIYGFLNYRNQNLVAKGKTEFNLIWGNRPLVDNWRRRQTIRKVAGQRKEIAIEQSTNDRSTGSDSTAMDLDLEAIPRTESQKNKVKTDRVTAYYQLGNVLFLDLNQPDNAKTFFHRVISSDDNPMLHPRAMYALYEVFSAQQQADSSRYWADRIRRTFPKSQYAKLVKGIKDKRLDSDTGLLRQYKQVAAAEGSDMPSKLRSLAIQHKSDSLASHIHFKAIEAYIFKAKQLTADVLSFSEHDEVQMVSADRNTPSWDSVRVILAEHDSLFPQSAYQSDVQLLQEELSKPVDADRKLPSCKEQNIALAVAPTMEAFLQSVKFPEQAADLSLSGTVRYTFVVDTQGKVVSYKLTSDRTSLGIEDALEEAFEESLAFKPLKLVDSISKIRCPVSFPIDQL